MKYQIVLAVCLGGGMLLAAACSPSSTPGASSPHVSETSTVPNGPAKTASTKWDMAAANKAIQEAVGAYPTVTGNTTQGINGNTVSVGCVSDNTANGVPTLFSGFCQGVQARIDQANVAKTVPYQIKLVGSADTGSNPSTQATELTDAISSEKVFGMFIGAATLPLTPNPMETAHIPYFGEFSNCGKQNPFAFADANALTVCSAIYSETNNAWKAYSNGILAAYVKPKNINISSLRYAGISSDTSAYKQLNQVVSEQYKAAGAEVVYTSSTLPATSGQAVNLNPYLTSLLNAKPNLIAVIVSDPQLLARVTGALKSAGVPASEIIGAYSPRQLDNALTAQNIDGALYTVYGIGVPSFGGQDWATLNAGATAVGASTPANQGFTQGWISADEFVQGLSGLATSGHPRTTENYTNFLNHGWEYPGVGNVVAPTIYPFGKYASPPCASIVSMNAESKQEVPYQDLTCGNEYIVKK
jgi:hypothetical protein